MPRRRRIAAVLAVLLALALGLSACGSSSSTSSSSTGGSTQGTTSFAKTKFVLHAGLAFGAFHHFIYKPYRQGNLTSGGLLNHKVALLKAGLAGAFAYHEVKLALQDAQSSPLLSRLLSPLTALQNRFQALGSQIKTGTIDRAGIEAANTQAAVTSAASKAAGQTITEATPSATQLAGG